MLKKNNKIIESENNKLYYIQKDYIGNSMCFYRENCEGYTINIKEAGKFNFDEACKIINSNDSYSVIAWECEYIDNEIQAHELTINSNLLNNKSENKIKKL